MESSMINCSHFSLDLYQLIEGITANPHKDLTDFLQQTESASNALPQVLKKTLENFVLQGNLSGTLLLQDCPQEPDIDSIATPQGISDKKSFFSESCLAMIGAELGDIFAYRQIDNGRLFHNITPNPNMEHEQSYAGSLVELEFHTEQHFHPYSPDFLLLYCLRSVPDAKTFFSSVREVLPELDEKYIDRLFEANFKTGIDHVFGNISTKKGNGPLLPVLYGDRFDPFLRYDQDLMIGVTLEAQEALEALQKALEKVKKSVCLKPGELLIVDNRRAVHGRSVFTPKFDGKDRWLQRAKVLSEVSSIGSEYENDTHIITTEFHLD